MLNLECKGKIRKVTPKVVDHDNQLMVAADIKADLVVMGPAFLRDLGLANELGNMWTDAGVPWSSLVKFVPLELKVHNVKATLGGVESVCDVTKIRLYPLPHHLLAVDCTLKDFRTSHWELILAAMIEEEMQVSLHEAQQSLAA